LGKIRFSHGVEEIAQFCQRWNIIELAWFGSVLSNDFYDARERDILIRLDLNARERTNGEKYWGVSLLDKHHNRHSDQ